MGDKPGRYWDFREARWVKHAAPEPVAVPEPADPGDDRLADDAEADVRSG